MKEHTGAESEEKPQGPHPESKEDSVASNLSEIKSLFIGKDATEQDDDPIEALADYYEGDEDPTEVRHDTSKFGIVLFFTCLAVIIIGILVVRSNEAWMADLDCFLSGDIQRCKLAGVEQQRAEWRAEEAATRPKYGDLILTYHPQDALVTIEQTVRRRPGHGEPLGPPETVKIPNRSEKLSEHELIEQLPLMNLPIREREQDEDGEITEVRHYSYKVQISRDGYEPREFEFEEDDWVRLGPDVNYSIPWQGVDLIPKLETIRDPFVAATREIHCAEVHFARVGEREGMTEGDLRGQIREIQVRHGFRTADEFSRFRARLTADEDWWHPIRDEIRKDDCR